MLLQAKLPFSLFLTHTRVVMRKIVALSVFLVFIGCDGLFAQARPSKRRLWGAVELNIAPSVVDANYSYDEPENDSYTLPTVGLNAFGGVYLFSRFSVGVGAGLSYLDNSRILYVPVLGELKYISPLRRREDVSCFIYGRGGYPFLLGRNKGDGTVVGVGWGLTFDNYQKTKYNISIGYSLTHLDYRTKSNHSRTPSRHAVELRFGLLW